MLVYSQTTLTGTVKNKQGESLIVNVTVQAKGSNTIAGFTMSDSEGKYSLTYKGTADSLVLTASGVSAGKHSRIVPNRPGQVDFSIEEKVMELKEVTVTAAPIRRTGDTLNYSVGAYTGKNDRTIEDVLKKLPGITVNESGAISYNKIPINKFYIEDIDLLQGRYGIATKNVEAKDVATVQVLENHQPIKALAGKAFSESAAINLKLKNSAKGKLILTALAGAGYEPVIWNAELVSMYFTAGKQNMGTYKGNNAGRDINTEIQAHYDYDYVSPIDISLLSIAMPSTPPVNKKRYLDNITHSVTENHLLKIGKDKDKELTVNAVYYNEQQEKEGYSLSEQFLPGNTSVRIEEDVESRTKTNSLELALKLNSNVKDKYFNNLLNIKQGWNSDRGTGITRSNVGDMDETMSQYLYRPSLSVGNNLEMIKNIGNKSYRIFFSTTYSHRPHHLTVTPAGFFGNSHIASLEQTVISDDFSAQIKTSYGLKIKNINMDYGFWGSVDVRGMDTRLTGTDTLGRYVPAADSLKNDLWYNTYQIGVNQNYTFTNNGKFKASLAIPVINYTLTQNDRIPDKFTAYNRWIINPSLTTSYDLTHDLTVSTGGSFRKNYGNMDDAYTGYIMHSYLSLLRNTVDRLFEPRSGGASASLQYRDAFRAVFFNIGVNYGKSWKNLLYGFDYKGIMQVKTTIDQPTESENYGIGFDGSKGFSFWRTTLRVSGGYNESAGEHLIQDNILKYGSESYRAGASIDMTPSSFLNLNYNMGWSQSRSFSKDLPERFPSIRSQNHTASVWLNPARRISINVSGDYRYNSAVDNRNITFFDTRMRYKNGPAEWELECNNLFNVREYVSASYTDLSTYFYRYNLRPRSFLLSVRFKLK
ncbi:TonB-dependent receptor [Bacteroidia bacterium]|nr:TonB-dependent receptor [Bacteroidia bacterium]